MKAITLTQPYASLVAIGAKCIETRSWRTYHRGLIGIHAGAGLAGMSKKEFYKLCQSSPFAEALGPSISLDWQVGDYLDPSALPRGALVAVARLECCLSTEGLVVGGYPDWQLTEQERAFGNYEPGRWGWCLSNVQRLAEPIPAKGALGLWNCEISPDLARALGVPA